MVLRTSHKLGIVAAFIVGLIVASIIAFIPQITPLRYAEGYLGMAEGISTTPSPATVTITKTTTQYVTEVVTEASIISVSRLAPPVKTVKATYGSWPFEAVGTEYVIELKGELPVVLPSIHYSPEEIANFDELVDELGLSGEHIRYLLSKGFFAAPSTLDNPVDLFGFNDFRGLPTYVTIDSMLYTYLLVLDHILSSVEEEYLAYWLKEVLEEIYYNLLEYGLSHGFTEPVSRALIYVSVPLYFLEYPKGLPDYDKLPLSVRKVIEDEVELINRHKGFVESPFLGKVIDYSMFKVRGHYTRSELLANYFKAVTWFGEVGLNEGDVESVALIVLALKSSARTFKLWVKLNSVVTFVTGLPKDLTPQDIVKLMPGEASLANYDMFKDEVITKISRLLKGKKFSMLPRRETLDFKIFKELTHEEVHGRYLPKGLDILAVLGYDRALDYLSEDLNTYSEYGGKLNQLREVISNMSLSDWYGCIHTAILYVDEGIVREVDDALILNVIGVDKDAWEDRALTTALGSWSISRHHIIPYVKQMPEYSLTMTIATPTLIPPSTPPKPSPIREKPHPGFVDPLPSAWSRLAILVNITLNGLKDLRIVSYGDLNRLSNLLELIIAFRDIAVKEVKGEVSINDLSILNELVPKLDEILAGIEGVVLRPKDPDVFTSPYTGEILFAETGFLDVAVILYRSSDGKIFGAVGPILTYYEFKGTERLTDEEWFIKLLSGSPPGLPIWVSSYRCVKPMMAFTSLIWG